MFAEGLILPPVRLYRAGEPEAVVWTILENNSRTPDKVLGDIRALVSGVNVMARRIEELMERYGVDGLAEYIDDYLHYTETRMREELRLLPAGTYRGGFVIDSDGIETDKTYNVVVEITLPGDGTDPPRLHGHRRRKPRVRSTRRCRRRCRACCSQCAASSITRSR